MALSYLTLMTSAASKCERLRLALALRSHSVPLADEFGDVSLLVGILVDDTHAIEIRRQSLEALEAFGRRGEAKSCSGLYSTGSIAK